MQQWGRHSGLIQLIEADEIRKLTFEEFILVDTKEQNKGGGCIKKLPMPALYIGFINYTNVLLYDILNL